MRKLVLTAALIAAPALAFADDCAKLSPDAVLGTTEAEVTGALKEMGFEIRKAEDEDGKIEVYFLNETTMGEVYVSPETGKITKMTCKAG